MKPPRRVWVEHLPAGELGHPSTRRLLARYGLFPLIALPPDGQTAATRRALERLGADGIPVGLWPLLTDEAGYWPSAHNLPVFIERVREALAFTAGIPGGIRALAVDLEPPVAVMRRLLEGPRWPVLAAGVLSGGVGARTRFIDAERRLSGLLRDLAADRIETLAAILPPLVLDLFAERRVWQGLFRTPMLPRAFDVISPMLYSSILKAVFPCVGQTGARACLHVLTRRLVRLRGSGGACVSLGLVGMGKLVGEPTLSDPQELMDDVRAVVSGGASDLALFSLEGVMCQSHPERWLDVFTAVVTDPEPPPGLTRWEWALSVGTRLTRWLPAMV